MIGGVLAGFEVTDILLDGELRPVSDKKSKMRWVNYKGDLITFDDEDTRSAKAKWAVSHLNLHRILPCSNPTS